MEVPQFLVEGGHKKRIGMGNCLKRRLGQFAGGLEKNREGVFEGLDTLIHTFWYMPELKIGIAVSALNFDQSFLQFNAKKKINAKKSSLFKFKC